MCNLGMCPNQNQMFQPTKQAAFLVIFDWMPDFVNFSFGATYFCFALIIELCSGM